MKVRVLHCLETIGPGGVEQRRLSISRYLDHEVYEQVLTCTKVVGDFDQRLESAGTHVVRLGIMRSPFNFTYYRRLFRVIREFRPHIIHGAVFEGVISAVVGGLFCKVPVIIIEETSEPANRSWRGHLLLRLLSLFANAVVAISPPVYQYLTVGIRIPASKTHLILNGVEPPETLDAKVVDDCREALGLTTSDFIVGSVGRLLDNHKLFSVLIKAFKKVSSVHGNMKLLLVGDGVDRTRLEQLVHELELGSRVTFAGHQADVRPYLSIMNVFALVPAREGFGMAAVEAMFIGLPVIATKVGGLQQIVVDQETGILIEANDVEALCNALEFMYAHPETRLAMGRKGYQRAQEKYTAGRYVKDVAVLYQSLIDRKLAGKI